MCTNSVARDDYTDGVHLSLVYYAAPAKTNVPTDTHLTAHGDHAFRLRPTKMLINDWRAAASTRVVRRIGTIHDWVEQRCFLTLARSTGIGERLTGAKTRVASVRRACRRPVDVGQAERAMICRDVCLRPRADRRDEVHPAGL